MAALLEEVKAFLAKFVSGCWYVCCIASSVDV